MIAIGQKLRQLRELKGFSQECVANHIGISQKTYSQIENGKTDIKLGDLEKISQLFELGISDILSFNEKQVINSIINSKYVGQNFINQNISEWKDALEMRMARIEQKLDSFKNKKIIP